VRALGVCPQGQADFRFADHEEVLEAGDAFYLPPGHVPLAEAGSEYIQFSPSEELQRVASAMMKNMQEMQSA
jgi:ribosomal protein L16 Arg81 hydroxylase